MSSNSPKIGFLFDLDGVLIDSENEYTKIWAQINEEYPTHVPNFEYLIKGRTLSKILADYYPTESLRKTVADRLHELEGKMQYRFLPYAKEFLTELKTRGEYCALVTSSDDKKMNHLWEELPEIKDFFNFIVTGDLVTRSKPDPEGYLLASEKIKCLSKNCVVFEDSLQGVMSGKNAGAYVVGIAGTLSKETLAPYSDIIVDTFNEIDLDSLIQILKNR